MRHKWTNPNRVIEFIQVLNEQNGWNLVGGTRSKEFHIRSITSSQGKYYFDGADLERLIFFEYDDLSHTYSSFTKQRDVNKQIALQQVLRQHKRTGTLVRYDEVSGQISTTILQ
jgi:hypothetical protein